MIYHPNPHSPRYLICPRRLRWYINGRLLRDDEVRIVREVGMTRIIQKLPTGAYWYER
jgi:hypothetical protein